MLATPKSLSLITASVHGSITRQALDFLHLVVAGLVKIDVQDLAIGRMPLASISATRELVHGLAGRADRAGQASTRPWRR